jgi:hypothetical protein
MPRGRRRAAIVGSITGLLGLGIIQYRRSNRRAAVAALHDAIEPPGVDEPDARTAPEVVADESHAPGHRHLAPPPRSGRPTSIRWARDRADRIGHPGRFG